LHFALDCCQDEPAARVLEHRGIGWELSMRSPLAVATALFLLLGTGVVEAADATLLAETGGFLLGNAQRCGVPTERVERAGKTIHGFIAAAAKDSSEVAAADSRFAEIFRASAVQDN